MKEIKEIFIPLGEAISALSAGQLLSHAESFYCPAVIGFAASLVEVIGCTASLVEEIKNKWKSSFNGKTTEQPPYSAKSLYTLTV